jgi:L-glutamine-phosphate cytidylyltransferase
MIRRAIILAAGRGARLHPFTDGLPKCLLPLGGGTLLSRHLDACVASGIDEIVLVTGYEFEKIEREIERWRGATGASASVSTIYNPFFATTNNMFSLLLARHAMDADFLVVNADNVLSEEALRIIARHDEHPILVPIARHEAYDAEDMKVRVVGGRLVEIAKTIPLDEASGESIGVRAFRREGRALLVDELEAMARDSDPATAWYITAVSRIAARGGPVGVIDIAADACMDVDFPHDLERARRDFAD